MRHPSHLASLLAPSILLVACNAPPSFEQLSAVAWTQTAAEHDALCRQTFASALNAVKAAKANAKGTKPLAVVLDVDETVLDNSPYQAANVLDGKSYADPAWSAWVAEHRAEALPGAVEFTKACAELDVTPIFITNRLAADEAATRVNLHDAGFPLVEDFDCVLTKGDVDKQSDKTARRNHVTATYDVLVWLGDDLGDFVLPAKTREDRRKQEEANKEKWGTTWFVLPNAMYGSWERALATEAGVASPEAQLRALHR